MPDVPGIKDRGFQLNYEDFDRSGTAGVSRQLRSTSIEDAVQEARSFLKQMPRLPKQVQVVIKHSFVLDVTDMSLGK